MEGRSCCSSPPAVFRNPDPNRYRTAPPVSVGVRVRVSVSFSVTVLCLQLGPYGGVYS